MRPNITELRETLTDIVRGLPGVERVQTQLGPSDYKADEMNFLVTVIVGKPGEESEKVVDELFSSVREAINETDRLSAFTSKCSGHRLYAENAQTPPSLGCEWQVKVLA